MRETKSKDLRLFLFLLFASTPEMLGAPHLDSEMWDN